MTPDDFLVFIQPYCYSRLHAFIFCLQYVHMVLSISQLIVFHISSSSLHTGDTTFCISTGTWHQIESVHCKIVKGECNSQRYNVLLQPAERLQGQHCESVTPPILVHTEINYWMGLLEIVHTYSRSPEGELMTLVNP